MTKGHIKKFTVERVFLKDLSFETPMGDCVFNLDWKPEYDISMSLNRGDFTKDIRTVVLTASITARLGDRVAFLIEVQQAGHFTIHEQGQEEDEPFRRILRVDAPNILFPYLREAVDSVTNKGGFPSVTMQVPDFEAWHQQAEADLAAARSSQSG